MPCGREAAPAATSAPLVVLVLALPLLLLPCCDVKAVSGDSAGTVNEDNEEPPPPLTSFSIPVPPSSPSSSNISLRAPLPCSSSSPVFLPATPPSPWQLPCPRSVSLRSSSSSSPLSAPSLLPLDNEDDTRFSFLWRPLKDDGELRTRAVPFCAEPKTVAGVEEVAVEESGTDDDDDDDVGKGDNGDAKEAEEEAVDDVEEEEAPATPAPPATPLP